MNHQLAKTLKDAGFPFDWNGFEILDDDDTSNYPTLAELIEACGSAFDSLRKHVMDDSWRADAYWALPELPETEWFDTPDEAVMRLWLALRAEKNRSNNERQGS